MRYFTALLFIICSTEEGQIIDSLYIIVFIRIPRNFDHQNNQLA